MKHFSKFTIIIASLAMLLVLAIGVRSSVAYFTSYAQSDGGETVQLVHREEIDEEVTGLSKAVTITNPAYDKDGRPSQPVFVRARAYTGEQFKQYFHYAAGAGWRDGGDGWWYYDEVLQPGGAPTTVLNAYLADIPVDENGAIIMNGIEVDQDQVNVVVLFESTLALYNYVSEGVYEPYAYWGRLTDEGYTVVER